MTTEYTITPARPTETRTVTFAVGQRIGPSIEDIAGALDALRSAGAPSDAVLHFHPEIGLAAGGNSFAIQAVWA